MFWTNALIDVLLGVYVIDCLFMGLVIMMQRSKQEGLGAAFGGGITESVWGAQTSNVLVRATVWATILFFVLSISLARLYSNREAAEEKASAVQQELLSPVAAPKPAATPGAPTNSAGQPVVPTATPMAPAPVAPAAPVPAATATPATKPSTAPPPASK